MKKHNSNKYTELVICLQGFIEMLDKKKLLNKIVWASIALMFLFELAPILNAIAHLLGK